MIRFGSGASYGYDSGYDSGERYGFALDPGYSFGHNYWLGYGYGLGNYFGHFGSYCFYRDYNYGDVRDHHEYIYAHGGDAKGFSTGDGRVRYGFQGIAYGGNMDDVWRKR